MDELYGQCRCGSSLTVAHNCVYRNNGADLSEETLEALCEAIWQMYRGDGFAYRAWRLYAAPDFVIRCTFGIDDEARDAFLQDYWHKHHRSHR